MLSLRTCTVLQYRQRGLCPACDVSIPDRHRSACSKKRRNSEQHNSQLVSWLQNHPGHAGSNGGKLKVLVWRLLDSASDETCHAADLPLVKGRKLQLRLAGKFTRLLRKLSVKKESEKAKIP